MELSEIFAGQSLTLTLQERLSDWGAGTVPIGPNRFTFHFVKHPANEDVDRVKAF
jgi:hypothetical protein